MVAGVSETRRRRKRRGDTRQFVSAVGIALSGQRGSSCSQEGNTAEHAAAVVELIFPPYAIRDTGDPLSGGIRDGNAAGGCLIVTDFC